MSLSTHLQPMSRLGRVVGYFRNVNALMSFYGAASLTCTGAAVAALMHI